MDKANLNRN